MGKMMVCDCGWMMMSPMGEGDIMKHAKMHMMDAHPGMKMSDAEMKKMMKTV